MKRYILASGSPRRRELIKNLNINFEIIPSKYKEELDNKDFTYKKIEKLAYNKALYVANELSDNSIIIGADTVVVYNNQILTKPINRENAISMLNLLSGKEHSVVTAIAVIDKENQKVLTKSVTTKVCFNNLSEELIINYIDKFKPFDKAGAYGIQELPKAFINYIKGSKENVIGLCTNTLKEMLEI